MKQTSTQVVVLAAGKGSRMQSELPKVLHQIDGQSLISHVLDTAEALEPSKVIIVVGYKSEMVVDSLDGQSLVFVKQEQQLGTGHAVMQCQSHIDADSDVLVLYGDVPFITSATLSQLINNHKEEQNDASILSSTLADPTGYGRVIRDGSGNFIDIKEEKDASDEERKITEINTGIYVFKGSALREYITKLNNNNSQNEFYLTDIFSLLLNSGRSIGSTKLTNYREAIGINTQKELTEASLQSR